MKICLFPHNSGAGGAFYIRDFAEYLSKRKDVEVVAIGTVKPKNKNIKFIKQPKSWVEKLIKSDFITELPVLSFFKTMSMSKQVAKIMNKLDCDVVHIGAGTIHSLKKPAVKIGWDVPNNPKELVKLALSQSNWYNWWYYIIKEIEYRFYSAITWKDIDVIAAPTKILQKRFQEKKMDAVFLPPGIEIRKQNKKFSRLTLCFAAGDIGRSAKGLRHLLAALSEVKKKDIDFELKVVGSIPKKINLMLNKYPNIKENISLLGYMQREDLLTLISKSHILAVPSQQEEFGYLALEGMMFGTAVIGNKIPPFKELLLPNQGIVTNVYNKQRFARDLYKLMSNKRLRESVGKRARKRAIDIYSWDSVYKKFLKLVQDIL